MVAFTVMVDMGGLLNLHESNVSYNRINSHKTNNKSPNAILTKCIAGIDEKGKVFQFIKINPAEPQQYSIEADAEVTSRFLSSSFQSQPSS